MCRDIDCGEPLAVHDADGTRTHNPRCPIHWATAPAVYIVIENSVGSPLDNNASTFLSSWAEGETGGAETQLREKGCICRDSNPDCQLGKLKSYPWTTDAKSDVEYLTFLHMLKLYFSVLLCSLIWCALGLGAFLRFCDSGLPTNLHQPSLCGCT